MTSPFFSIIMPTHQRRDMVCEAVRALCRLSYNGPVEIIVVINGSTDGTAAALAKLDCPFPLCLIEQEDRGPAGARNRGGKEAAGDILLFLDDDMICEPDVLEQHARFIADGADAVTGEIPIDPGSQSGLITDRLAAAASWKRDARPSAFHVYSGHLSVRKTVFQEVGGFDEKLQARGYGGEDLDLGVRLIERYDVRHNEAAVAWQRNLIGPSEHMKRARLLAASDLRLIAKHPQITAELVAHRGAPEGEETPLALRLSRLPGLPSVIASAAASVAEIARRTPFRSSSLLARFYFSARTVAYWSAFQTRAGKTILRDCRRDEERYWLFGPSRGSGPPSPGVLASARGSCGPDSRAPVGRSS